MLDSPLLRWSNREAASTGGALRSKMPPARPAQKMSKTLTTNEEATRINDRFESAN
jgi:hypothetical protein